MSAAPLHRRKLLTRVRGAFLLAILRLGRGGGGDASSFRPVLGPAAALPSTAKGSGVAIVGVVERTSARTGAVERRRAPSGAEARGRAREASSVELRRVVKDMVGVGSGGGAA